MNICDHRYELFALSFPKTLAPSVIDIPFPTIMLTLTKTGINLSLSSLARERECSCIIALGLWNIDPRFLKWPKYSFDIVTYISYSKWKGGCARVNLHISYDIDLICQTKTTITRKQAGTSATQREKILNTTWFEEINDLGSPINVATDEDYGSLKTTKRTHLTKD